MQFVESVGLYNDFQNSAIVLKSNTVSGEVLYPMSNHFHFMDIMDVYSNRENIRASFINKALSIGNVDDVKNIITKNYINKRNPDVSKLCFENKVYENLATDCGLFLSMLNGGESFVEEQLWSQPSKRKSESRKNVLKNTFFRNSKAFNYKQKAVVQKTDESKYHSINLIGAAPDPKFRMEQMGFDKLPMCKLKFVGIFENGDEKNIMKLKFSNQNLVNISKSINNKYIKRTANEIEGKVVRDCDDFISEFLKANEIEIGNVYLDCKTKERSFFYEDDFGEIVFENVKELDPVRSFVTLTGEKDMTIEAPKKWALNLAISNPESIRIRHVEPEPSYIV